MAVGARGRARAVQRIEARGEHVSIWCGTSVGAINSFFVEDSSTGTLRSPRAYRLARGYLPYRPISYALVAPRRRGAIGAIAESTFKRRYGGLRGLREIDYVLMARALGGSTNSRGELLSFLLFDHVFITELLELGRRNAARWLRRHPRFWCRDASHDLSLGKLDQGVVKEEQALEEFRTSGGTEAPTDDAYRGPLGSAATVLGGDVAAP